MRSVTRHPPAFVLGMLPMGLAVARALGREGIQVFGFDHPPQGKALPPGLSSRFVVPVRCPDPTAQPLELLDVLLAHARRHPTPPVLFAADDVYIEFVVRHREALAPALRFALPPPDVAEALLDKRKQHALAQRGGLTCPATFFPSSPHEAREIQDAVDYPAFIKPCLSHVWRRRFQGLVVKGFRVDSPAELVTRFDEAFAAGLPVIVQSVVLGPPTNHLKFCAYVARNGDLLATYTGRKLRQFPVQFGNGTLCESAPVPEVVQPGLGFLARVGYRGYASLEMMRDQRDGQVKFIELNARPILHQSLLVDAGVNFSLAEYLDLAEEPQRRIGPQRYGVRWWNGPEDVKAYWYSRGELSFAAWVRSWKGATSSPVTSWSDPVPAVRWYLSRAARALGRLVARVPRRLRERRRRYAGRSKRRRLDSAGRDYASSAER